MRFCLIFELIAKFWLIIEIQQNYCMNIRDKLSNRKEMTILISKVCLQIDDVHQNWNQLNFTQAKRINLPIELFKLICRKPKNKRPVQLPTSTSKKIDRFHIC